MVMRPDDKTELREPLPGNIEIRQDGNRVVVSAEDLNEFMENMEGDSR